MHYQGLLFMLKIIQIELTNWHHYNQLIGHFDINKTRELISRKYYWPSLKKNVEAYVKGCNVCWALKAVKHKFYSDFQALPIPTH